MDDMVDSHDLAEAEAHIGLLERQLNEADDKICHLENELLYMGRFRRWLEVVYPNAEKEFNAVETIMRSV